MYGEMPETAIQNLAEGSRGPRGPYRGAPPGPALRGGREESPGIGVVGLVGDSKVLLGCRFVDEAEGEPDLASGEYPFPPTLASDVVDPSVSWKRGAYDALGSGSRSSNPISSMASSSAPPTVAALSTPTGSINATGGGGN